MCLLRQACTDHGLLGQGILIQVKMDYHIEDDLSNTVPEPVREILKTIRNAGYEAYIVGGCVRDILLKREPGDWDITTSALPEVIKSLFAATADTGIQHGTVMVLMKGCGYEVTTYRIDGEYTDGRHPESVTFTPSLEEDLKRRDFTINAFAYDPETGIVDLFDGLADLKAGIIRAVGDPYQRFAEDALRIMRAVRFAAQLSFDIEDDTMDAISSFAGKLALVSAERIRVEFEKTLYSDNPGHVNMYRELGLSEYIVPEVSDKCFMDESLAVYDRLKEKESGAQHGELSEHEQVLRLAAFFGGLSDTECAGAMRAMTFDNRRRDLVCSILKYHEEVTAGIRAVQVEYIKESSEEPGDKHIPAGNIRRKIKTDLRHMGTECYELCLGYNEACGLDMSVLRSHLDDILADGEAFAISMLDISGNDLITAGVPEGRAIGDTLNRLLDAVIEDPSLNVKEKLMETVNH